LERRSAVGGKTLMAGYLRFNSGGLGSLGALCWEERPRQAPVLLGETPLTRLSHLSGVGDTLLVTFSPLRVRLDATAIWADMPLRKLNIPALGFVAKSDHWYPFDDTMTLIRSNAPILRNYSHVVLYGYSMGAYAALKFSAALGARKVIALSPQFSIDPQDTGQADARFAAHFNPAINDGMALERGDIGGEPYLFYDPSMPEDAMHASHIAGLAPCHRVVMPFAGHGTANFVAKSGASASFFAMIGRPETDLADMRRFIRIARLGSPEYLCRIGDRLAARGRIADAQRAVGHALAREQNNIHTQFRQLDLFLKAGQRDEAMQAFERLSARPSESAAHAVKICQAYEAAGEKHRAPARLREEISRWPHEPLLRIKLALLLFEQGQLEQARGLAFEAAKLKTKSWRVYKNLALLYQKIGETKRASEVTRLALNLSPDDAEARLFAVDIFLKLEDPTSAGESIDVLERRLSLSPVLQTKLWVLKRKLQDRNRRRLRDPDRRSVAEAVGTPTGGIDRARAARLRSLYLERHSRKRGTP